MSKIHIIPYVIPFVLQYVTCPRFDRRYPHTYFNLVTGKSLFSFYNTISRDLHLVTLLAKLVCDVVLPSGPRDTSPSHGVTNPSLDPY